MLSAARVCVLTLVTALIVVYTLRLDLGVVESGNRLVLHNVVTPGLRGRREYDVFESAHADRKRYIANVCTLHPEPTSEEMKGFYARLGRVWPGLSVRAGRSFLNDAKLPGLGINVCTLFALQEAENMIEDFDYLLLFEDDAKFFQTTSWPDKPTNELDRRVELLEQANGQILLLGGHDFTHVDEKELALAVSKQGITSIHGAWGAYGVMVSRDLVPELASLFLDALAHKDQAVGEKDAADNLLASFAAVTEKETGTPIMYASVPLMVDHPNHKYSATWHKIRDLKWAGQREWYYVDRNYKDASGHHKSLKRSP